MLDICYAFVLPNILYGLLNWGSASKTALDPLRKKLNNDLRLITFKNKAEHSKPIFKCLNTLNFEDCYKLKCAKFMYDINKSKAETSFSKLFKKAKIFIITKHDMLAREILLNQVLEQNLVKNS